MDKKTFHIFQKWLWSHSTATLLVPVLSVSRVSTIVEILKILSKLFRNKNPKNYMNFHFFFLQNFGALQKFSPHFHKKNSTI